MFDFRSANWSDLKNDFTKIPWNCAFLEERIDNVWEAWKTFLFQVVEKNIPTKLIRPKRNVLWFNAKLKKLIHKKRRLWKQAKSSVDECLWSPYKKFSNEVKSKLSKAYVS